MVNPETLNARMQAFRSRCTERGLSLTHQRWVIYRVLAGTDQHPSPEAIFEKVRKQIPPISLATVYNNINVFLDAGLLREVSTPDHSRRLDANLAPHYHLLCARCGTVLDLSEDSLAPICSNKALPKGFRVQSYSLTLSGFCGRCAPRV